MDLELLKGLKVTEEKDKATQYTQTTTEQPRHLFDKLSSAFSEGAPPSVQAAQPQSRPEHHGLFDKLNHAVGGHSDPPPPPPPQPKHEDLLTKASHLFGGESEAAPPPPPPEPKHETLFDKVTDALGGDRREAVQQPPPPPPPEHKNVFEKISDAFSGEKNTPPPPPPSAPKYGGLSETIHDALHGGGVKAGVSSQTTAGHEDVLGKLGLGHQSEPVPPKEESLLDKIGSSFHHEPPKEPTLGEKLGSKLGLGKTEKEEDHLDKTIDFVQEHVLHQGDQHNEGQFEQWKDDQIADAIRSQFKHTTGREFSLKEKKSEE